MRHWIGTWFIIWFAIAPLAVYGKSTFTVPATALTADKSAVYWPKKSPGETSPREVYTVAVTLSDAGGDRAVRNVTVSADGRISVDGAATTVPGGAAFVAAVRAFGAVVDKVVDAVVKAGEVRL